MTCCMFMIVWLLIGVPLVMLKVLFSLNYKEICEYENGYTFKDHRLCLLKSGCGSDGSLCPNEYTPQFCPMPKFTCKIVKI